MRRVGASLAVLAAGCLAGGAAFGQGGPVVVGEAPVHAVPADEGGPVEASAVPGTLNAQYAARSRAPAAQSRPVEGPAVAIAPRLIDSAGAFEAYVRKAGALDGKFADGGAVAKAVTTGASYESQQFEEGLVTYAALAALQDQTFVQDLSDIARDPRDRDAMAERLFADPGAVMEVEGADEAAGMAGGILARMGVNLLKSGRAVKQSAYDLQRQAWSKEAVPDPEKRLAETKSQSAAKASLDAAETDALIKTIVELRKAGPPTGRNAQPAPVVLRGLALAALAVFGRAGEEDLPKLEPLLGDAKSADCMKMAKLNLYQCMAVAGPHYEDVFCLGQHALVDTGQCVVAAAGGQSLVPATELKVATAPVHRSVSVPIALGAADQGPERRRAYAPVSAEPPPPPPPVPAPRAVARDEASAESAQADDHYAEADDQAAEDRAEDRAQADRVPAPDAYRDDRPAYTPPPVPRQPPAYARTPAPGPTQAPIYGQQPPAYGQAPSYNPEQAPASSPPPSYAQAPSYSQPPAYNQAPGYSQAPAYNPPPAYAQAQPQPQQPYAPQGYSQPPAYSNAPAYSNPPSYGYAPSQAYSQPPAYPPQGYGRPYGGGYYGR